jgi:hypothetical protein
VVIGVFFQSKFGESSWCPGYGEEEESLGIEPTHESRSALARPATTPSNTATEGSRASPAAALRLHAASRSLHRNGGQLGAETARPLGRAVHSRNTPPVDAVDVVAAELRRAVAGTHVSLLITNFSGTGLVPART